MGNGSRVGQMAVIPTFVLKTLPERFSLATSIKPGYNYPRKRDENKMNIGNSNRVTVALRDGSCGVGGIRCHCCNRLASGVDRTDFNGRVRTRAKNFVSKDLARNPF